MLSARIESERPEPLPPTGVAVGLDLGVGTLVTAFDGTGFPEVEAPRHLRKQVKRRRRAQRALSRRRRKGSHRRRTQARKVAVIHREVREERRKDILHRIPHRLTAEADVVRVERLNVRGLLRNRRPAMSVADAGLCPASSRSSAARPTGGAARSRRSSRGGSRAAKPARAAARSTRRCAT